MSLAAYVLTGCWRRSLRSSEGAMKYFLMGAFATGFLVYGIALVYGTTGGELSLRGDRRQGRRRHAGRRCSSSACYFIIVALGFKVAAVPFHMWAPDAYEGAPTPVTGFMAAGVKAAAFGALVRLLGTAFSSPLLARLHRLGVDPVGARGADDDARQPGGAPPGEHQAYARVLVDRARRLPADRRGRRRASASPTRAAGGALLSRRLHLHHAGRVRRRGLDRQPRRRAPVRRRLGRPGRRAVRPSRWR